MKCRFEFNRENIWYMSRDEVNFANCDLKNTQKINFSKTKQIKIFLRKFVIVQSSNVIYCNNNIVNFLNICLFFNLKRNACHVTGIIYYAYERSRRKPVDEEDSKLGRWVSQVLNIQNLKAMALKRYVYFYEILFFFVLLQSTHLVSYYICYFTLCFGKSSATLSCYRTLHPSSNFRSHVSKTFLSYATRSTVWVRVTYFRADNFDVIYTRVKFIGTSRARFSFPVLLRNSWSERCNSPLAYLRAYSCAIKKRETERCDDGGRMRWRWWRRDTENIIESSPPLDRETQIWFLSRIFLFFFLLPVVFTVGGFHCRIATKKWPMSPGSRPSKSREKIPLDWSNTLPCKRENDV